MNNINRKKAIVIVCVIAAVIAVAIIAYYSVMNSKAEEIGKLKGKSYAAVKQAAEENGFSVSTVKTDKSLLKSLKNKSVWTVDKISSDPWKRSTKVALSPSPEAVTRAFLDGIKSDDQEMIKAAYEGDGFDIKEIAFVNDENFDTSDDYISDLVSLREESLYPRLIDFDYTITNVSTDAEETTVSIDLTGYNIGAMYGQAVSDYYSEGISLALSGATDEQLQSLLIGHLRSNLESLTSKEYKNSCDIQLVKDGATWRVKTINRDDDVTNILTCGLRNAIDDIYKAY